MDSLRQLVRRQNSGCHTAILLCAALTVVGGFRPLLQTVAWTGMLVRYSRTAPVQEAVRKTFDGQHPCAMCLALRAAGADEKSKQELSAPAGPELTHLFFLAPLPWQSLMAAACRMHAASASGLDLSFPPPHPPPRDNAV